MTSLAAYALSLILFQFPPGYSQASLERLPECGPKTGDCDNVAPICPSTMTACAAPSDEKKPCCAVPFWHDELGWVRYETRDTGAKRLEIVAQALADGALYHGSAWKEGPRDLVRFVIAAGGWGMGFREDVQTGRKRGKAGEVSLMDFLPSTLRTLVPYDMQKLSDKELAERFVGLDYDSQRRVFDAGALLLIRARREAEKRCKGHIWEYATFALYATGGDCATVRQKKNPETGKVESVDWLAGPRYNSLRKFRARQHTVFPSWYAPPKISDS